MTPALDSVDRGILYMLQLDARNTTSADIANKVGVSPSTIRNRIERLEGEGVIQGYIPKIDYESANLPFQVVFVVTAPPDERESVVGQLMDIQGVVDVREMLTGQKNIHVEVVGEDTQDIVRITDAIHDLGVDVESSEIMKRRRTQPFNHFYFSDAIDGLDAGDGDGEVGGDREGDGDSREDGDDGP